jgi:hypothetical protein
MNYTISSCLVKSSANLSHPNGELTARASVNFFDNKNVGKYDPVKVKEILITNPNSVVFFKRDETISVSALRAIADGLIEIADAAEKAHARMAELNK